MPNFAQRNYQSMSIFTKALLPSILRMRCPQCRKGRIFVNRSVFPLSKCLDMVDACPVCTQSLKFNTNNGPGINYALTLIIFFLNILWYWPIFGISYKDNSFYYFLATTTAIVIVIQPWLMRYTRILYLYFIISYGSLRSAEPQPGSELG